jgi:hypothetical protein
MLVAVAPIGVTATQFGLRRRGWEAGWEGFGSAWEGRRDTMGR